MARYARIKMRPNYPKTIREMIPGNEYQYPMSGRNTESFRIAIVRETAKGKGRWEQVNDYDTKTITIKRIA